MRSSGRAAIAAGTGVALCLGCLAALAWVEVFHHQTPSAPAVAAALCTSTTRPMIPASSLPNYTTDVAQELYGVPVKGSGNSDSILESDYKDGRLEGFVINAAVKGPDRAEEDAWSRAHNYTIQAMPYVPLSGPVVRDTPGALEIYESVVIYKSPQGAGAYVQWLEAGRTWTPIPLPGVSGASAFFQPPQVVGNHLPNEGDYEVIQQFNDTVIRIDFEGGPGLTTGDIAPMATAAISRARGACT